MKKTALPALFLFLFVITSLATEKSEEEKRLALTSFLQQKYGSLVFEGPKPAFDIYKRAYMGFLQLKATGKVKNNKLSIIDFRMSSNEKRLWIIDVAENKVLFHSLVAHGKNSGWEFPKTFTNTPNSNTSSIGFYLTGEKYFGKYGLSLRLDGLERGFNDKARSRAIVMHPAKYVDASFTKAIGRMGRSFGCPAIPFANSNAVVKAIADRSVMLIFYPQKDYLQKTEYDNELAAYNFLMQSGVII